MRLLSNNKNKFLRRKLSNTEQLRDTGLFMPEWYLSQYPEIARSGIDPYEHYAKIGESEGFNPNPYFDVNWYKERSSAARRYNGLAIIHYAKHGWKNGVNPSNVFSGKLYLQEYRDVAKANINPLFHYLKIGRAENRLYFPVNFEFENGDKFIKVMKIVSKSGFFYRDWYQNYYTDLIKSDMKPLVHYVIHGASENRSPNPFFDASWYRSKYYNSIQDENPIVYYLEKGMDKGHIPISNFSSKLYFEQNPDLDEDITDAYSHFISQGYFEHRDFPNSDFITDLSQDSEGNDHRIPLPKGLRDMIDLPRNELSPLEKTYNPKHLSIHWIVPDFAPGGGGHMTIFRMAHYLELRGHDVTIWINDPSLHDCPENAYETVIKHFQSLKGHVRFIDDSDTPDSFKNTSGDIMVATDCWTVWPAMVPTNFKKRFYFVQDFEPAFHPMGGNYLAAEQSYKEDFTCICASPWLTKIMQENYGRKASHFWLAADKTIYNPPKEKPNHSIKRIAVYARHFTARRAVDLAFLALEKLAQNGKKFEVHFFGAPLPFKRATFDFVDHGIASPEQLAEIFKTSDIGVVFSATNYSLVPKEMMACKLPIIELSGENTDAIFPANVATFATPHPNDIANKLEVLLSNEELRNKQAANAYDWVQSFSWDKSAKMVEDAMLDCLSEKYTTSTLKQPTSLKEKSIKASVIIPTYNAGSVLKPVLDMVTNQKAPWDYEILVIDSGSNDGTVELVQSYDNVRFHAIESKDFNHGGTRNLGVSLTSGDFIAFLTHDARPANQRWLFNLVSALEHYPNAAGAFGKHYAYEDASPFTKRDLDIHFENMLAHPLCLSRDTDSEAYKNSVSWRQLLHFYSDNNSCMRRDIWKKIPYRTVKFGEDQLWANDIIKAGFAKVYAPQAAVFHSHDYDPEENYDRNKTESAFFKHFFGYKLIKDSKTLKDSIKTLNKRDKEWAKKHNIAPNLFEQQKALNASRLQGHFDGAHIDTNGMFE